MAKDWAKTFYSSAEWQNVRNAYAQSRSWLCERCESAGLIVPGEIVHHIEHLTAENINNPNVAVSFDNLQLLCRKCHAEVHENAQKRYKITQNGEVIIIP